MKVYLAGQYRQKEELQKRAVELWQANHVSVSSWLREPHDPNMTLAELSDADLREIAETDLADIRRADALMAFSVTPDEATKRGGRHVEFGYAMAHDKRLIVVGPKENIFHYLTDVEVYPDFATALRAISG